MKDYRNSEMKWLAIFYTALTLYYSTNIINIINSYTEGEFSFWAKVFESVFATSIIPLFVHIADSCISSKTKNWLLGSCILKPYGNTVFSDIASEKFKDERIDCKTAKEHFSSIIKNAPKDPKEKCKYENEQWYKLYSSLEENAAVKQTQKDWLAFRDLYCESIVFTLTYLISILLFDSISFSLELLLILLTITIVFNICSHIKMKRFVYTVIVKSALSQQ